MGSLADFITLEQALEAFQIAEDNAKTIELRATAEQERLRWCELAAAAAKCNWSYQTNETCIDWSTRMVRSFQKQFGKAA